MRKRPRVAACLVTVDVINNPTAPPDNARVAFEAWTVDGRLAGRGATAVSVAGGATSGPIDLGIRPLLEREGLLVVKLALTDGAGRTVSDNVYWPSASRNGSAAWMRWPAWRWPCKPRAERKA